MGGLLADVYSFGDSLKRKVRGLLADPGGVTALGVTRFGEDMAELTQQQQQAYGIGGPRSNDPATVQAAKQALADHGAQSGMAAATVWHGSPHKFDRFDSSKIGTGEGAQAYGHGLYLAEASDVAKTYLGTGKAKLGPAVESRLANTMQKAQDSGRYGEALALEELLINRSPAKAMSRFSDPSGGKQYQDALEAVKKYSRYFDEGGNLYKVDLPDEAIAKMLDWDKPLSQQSEAIKAAARKLGIDMEKAYGGVGGSGENLYKAARNSPEFLGVSQGAMLSGAPGWSQSIASQRLRDMGIPGIRYLDGGSRGTGAGTSNFVVFPGNEGLLTILERNGQPIR